MKEITEQKLSELRETVLLKMSPKRFRHTAAVEEMVARLCALYCPEMTAKLRAAALLHDVTKELTLAEQVALSAKLGLEVKESDLLSPKTFHARTAAATIPLEFAEFSDPVIMEAVRWHTTGHANMTLCEKLLYLADYIEAGRRFADCVALREAFWSAEPQKMDADARLAHLYRVLLRSFDFTLSDVEKAGGQPCLDTLAARQDIANRLQLP